MESEELEDVIVSLLHLRHLRNLRDQTFHLPPENLIARLEETLARARTIPNNKKQRYIFMLFFDK